MTSITYTLSTETAQYGPDATDQEARDLTRLIETKIHEYAAQEGIDLTTRVLPYHRNVNPYDEPDQEEAWSMIDRLIEESWPDWYQEMIDAQA